MLIYPSFIKLNLENNIEAILDKQDAGIYLLKCDSEVINLHFNNDNRTITSIDFDGGVIRVGDVLNLVYKVNVIRHSLHYQGIVIELKYENCKTEF